MSVTGIHGLHPEAPGQARWQLGGWGREALPTSAGPCAVAPTPTEPKTTPSAPGWVGQPGQARWPEGCGPGWRLSPEPCLLSTAPAFGEGGSCRTTSPSHLLQPQQTGVLGAPLAGSHGEQARPSRGPQGRGGGHRGSPLTLSQTQGSIPQACPDTWLHWRRPGGPAGAPCTHLLPPGSLTQTLHRPPPPPHRFTDPGTEAGPRGEEGAALWTTHHRPPPTPSQCGTHKLCPASARGLRIGSPAQRTLRYAVPTRWRHRPTGTRGLWKVPAVPPPQGSVERLRGTGAVPTAGGADAEAPLCGPGPRTAPEGPWHPPTQLRKHSLQAPGPSGSTHRGSAQAAPRLLCQGSQKQARGCHPCLEAPRGLLTQPCLHRARLQPAEGKGGTHGNEK
ncbi:proline-rich protein HaeIII subfamily 1-like [Balaenoptera musculus]|uniref:Proline-rich protein HaeIII subfamily 1-like n=1 Tax=Balaenoptera musculus TaxID=9771 RepID=A0A8B8Y617_BALMU|nr:proline-rich protein HaeIII subfamily 1-like [Balaenoptera musculus]